MAVKCFFGKTHSGKSYKANEHCRDYDKKIIFDPTPSKIYSATHTQKSYGERELLELLEKMIKMGKDSKFTLVFKQSPYLHMKKCAELVCCFAKAYGLYWGEGSGIKVALVLDELDKYKNTSDNSILGLVVGMGRHWGLDVVCISQVPAQLPKVIRDNASDVFCFPLGHGDYYEKFLGKEAADKLANGQMKKFSYYRKTDGGAPVMFDSKNREVK